nr:hypothetical protein [Desulfobacula sp.]
MNLIDHPAAVIFPNPDGLFFRISPVPGISLMVSKTGPSAKTITDGIIARKKDR